MSPVLWGPHSLQGSARDSRTHTQPSNVAVLAVLLAYGVGFWLVWQHHLAGAHEHHELPLALHWLRDSTLALPGVTVAVWLGLRLADRLWPRDAMARAATVALAASIALGLGEPAHGWLFGAEEESDLPVLEHVLRDTVAALAPALLITGAVTLERLIRRRSAATARTLAWMGSVTLALSTVLAGGAGDWVSAPGGDGRAGSPLSNPSAPPRPDPH